MWACERQFEFSGDLSQSHLLAHFLATARTVVQDDEILLRAVANGPHGETTSGDALILSGVGDLLTEHTSSQLGLRRRSFEKTSAFVPVVLIPTGIGCELGGHAGDAGALLKLVAEMSDAVITHPNVVNASDINESPVNTIYVEGSILSRLMLGTVSLQPVRSNRVLLVIDDHPDPLFANAAVNAINAARATYGLDCPGVLKLSSRVRMQVSYSESGRAVGEVTNLPSLVQQLHARRDEYDAVALSSVISVPAGYHQGYFDAGGEMVNPWGGVEAMLTHAVSTLFDVPAAHSPMFETRDIANADPGIVDPRMAAEAVSLTFLQCILKGLQRSPKIVCNQPLGQAGLIDVTDVSCLLIPEGCLGLPVLAALEQGIPVIAVAENANIMRNDLRQLAWRPGQYYSAANYLEAVGIMMALKSGVTPSSVRRPLPQLPVATTLAIEDMLVTAPTSLDTCEAVAAGD